MTIFTRKRVLESILSLALASCGTAQFSPGTDAGIPNFEDANSSVTADANQGSSLDAQVSNDANAYKDATQSTNPDAGSFDAGYDTFDSGYGDATNSSDVSSTDTGIADVYQPRDATLEDAINTQYDAGVNPDAQVQGGDAGCVNGPILVAPNLVLQAGSPYCMAFGDGTNLPVQCQGPTAPWAPGHSPNGTGSHGQDGKRIVMYELTPNVDNPLPRTSRSGNFYFGMNPGSFLSRLKGTDDQGCETNYEFSVDSH